MQQTNCKLILHAAEVAPVVKVLTATNTDLKYLEVPSFQTMLDSSPDPYPFEKAFHEAENDPIMVLHSSGSTGTS